MAYLTGTVNSQLDGFNAMMDFYEANGWSNVSSDRYEGLKDVRCSRYIRDYALLYFEADPDSAYGYALYEGDTISWQFHTPRELDALRIVMPALDYAERTPDTVYVESSSDGFSWDTVATFTGMTWTSHSYISWSLPATYGPRFWWRVRFGPAKAGSGGIIRIGTIYLRESGTYLRTYTDSMGATMVSSYTAQGNAPTVFLSGVSDPSSGDYTYQVSGGVSINSTTYPGSPWSIPELAYPSERTHSPVYDGAMTYWFFGDSRFILCVFKVSTVYIPICAGLFLPYASPAEYPYCMMVGGCTGQDNIKFSSERADLGSFVNPTRDVEAHASLQIYTPFNSWANVFNWREYYGRSRMDGYFHTMPFWNTAHGRTREDPSGVIIPENITIFSKTAGTEGIYGVIPLCYAVPGLNGISAEDTVPVSGVGELIVFNDIFRADSNSLWAVNKG